MARSRKSKNVIFEEDDRTSDTYNDPVETNPSTVENIISVGLGLAVVLVIGAMIVNVIRGRNNTPTPPTAATDEKTATVSGTYTVQSGDTLWSIAETHYNDGFKWTEIQKANNMTESSTLEKGMQLVIPKIEGAPTGASAATIPNEAITTQPSSVISAGPTGPSGTSPTGPTGSISTGTTGSQEPEQGQTSSASTERQYTILSGDTLWDISVKRYGNGYRWSEIAQMNNLSNPDLIFAGNTLLMP